MTTTTAETSQPGGLVGAMRSARRSANAVRHISLGDPLIWIVRCFLLAGAILIFKKAAANPDPTDMLVIGLLGLAALAAEYYMGQELVRAWFDRAIMRFFACIAIYCMVMGYAMMQWLGTASDMQATKSGLQKAAFVSSQTATTDKEAAFAELARQRALVKNLELERWRALPTVDGRTISSVGEAQAILKGQEARTRFWQLTKACTESTGPQTRAFVQTCTEARAALSAAQTRELLAPSLADAERRAKELEERYAAAKVAYERSDKTVISEARQDLHMLVTYAGISEAAARDLTAAWSIGMISVLVFVLAILVKARDYRDLPRKPWPFMVALRNAVRRVTYGSRYMPAATGMTTIQQVAGTVHMVDPSNGRVGLVTVQPNS